MAEAAAIPLRVREYGRDGPVVIVLHGGPGAPGYMAPVARGLADQFRVLEPLQRGGNAPSLLVADHIADLRLVIETYCSGARPALVGSSWGAMLGLAFAAAYPTMAGPQVLIGCGTFDEATRNRFKEILNSRLDENLLRKMRHLLTEIPDASPRLRAKADLLLPAYSYDLITDHFEGEPVDARVNEVSWADMVRLQHEGVYPQGFAAIHQPVLMLHGAEDPHPGSMIRASLAPYLPQLEYHEWERCGHYPWLERVVRDEFFSTLRSWLARHLE
jgi:pimeloyl-ACP methyl ester carboxylesterase